MIRAALRRRPLTKGWGALLITSLLIAGCTNSKFLVGLLYDRADDQAIEAAEEWVGFTASQREEFEAYVGTFHTWHRREELPRYAALMREITTGLSTWDQATPDDFSRWMNAAKRRAEAIRTCHPARYATPLTRTLSDAQIDRMERTWRDKRAENIARAGDRSRAERIDRRVANIDKWVGRLGVDLDPDQRELLRDAFTRQVSLRDRYRTLSDDWNEKLFTIARDQDAADYGARIDAHIVDWFGMAEKSYPEDWEANLRLWRDTAVAFEKTLSRKQRRDALRWIGKMADTLDAIARDTPDWLPADDPAYGCVVPRGASAAADQDAS